MYVSNIYLTRIHDFFVSNLTEVLSAHTFAFNFRNLSRFKYTLTNHHKVHSKLDRAGYLIHGVTDDRQSYVIISGL